MQKLYKLILSVVLLSMLAIRRGIALQCYNCDSSVSPECNDIKKSPSIKPVDCRPNLANGNEIGNWLKEITRIDYLESDSGNLNVPMICQKFTAKSPNDELVTYRGCQLHGGKTDVCTTVKNKASKHNIVIESCETCDEDACNKSSIVNLTSLWMLLVPFILKNFV